MHVASDARRQLTEEKGNAPVLSRAALLAATGCLPSARRRKDAPPAADPKAVDAHPANSGLVEVADRAARSARAGSAPKTHRDAPSFGTARRARQALGARASSSSSSTNAEDMVGAGGATPMPSSAATTWSATSACSPPRKAALGRRVCRRASKPVSASRRSRSPGITVTNMRAVAGPVMAEHTHRADVRAVALAAGVGGPPGDAAKAGTATSPARSRSR